MTVLIVSCKALVAWFSSTHFFYILLYSYSRTSSVSIFPFSYFFIYFPTGHDSHLLVCASLLIPFLVCFLVYHRHLYSCVDVVLQSVPFRFAPFWFWGMCHVNVLLADSCYFFRSLFLSPILFCPSCHPAVSHVYLNSFQVSSPLFYLSETVLPIFSVHCRSFQLMFVCFSFLRRPPRSLVSLISIALFWFCIN